MYCPICMSESCVREHSPPKSMVLRLHRKLRQQCAICGTGRKLHCSFDAAGSQIMACSACLNLSYHRTQVTCDFCGKLSELRMIRSDGRVVGKCCWHAPIEKCRSCLQHRPVYLRPNSRDAVCRICYDHDENGYRPKIRCTDCRQIKLVGAFISNHGYVCRSCYRKNSYAPRRQCVSCLKMKPAHAIVQSDSTRPHYVCNNCYRSKGYAPQKTCGRCGRLAYVKCIIRVNDQIAACCRACYSRYYQPKKRCCRCKNLRIVNAYVGAKGEPCCSSCFVYLRPKEKCIICNKFAEVKRRIQGKPQCFQCYRNTRTITAVCGICKKQKKLTQIKGEKICSWCYKKSVQPKYECAICHRLLPAAFWDGDNPKCATCHRRVMRS